MVAPVSKDGVALLGETSKVVPLAAKRFPAVVNAGNTHVTVTYAAEENKTNLSDYARVLPEVRAERGGVRACAL